MDGNFVQLLLDQLLAALPMLSVPVATWLATLFVKWLKPQINNIILLTLVVGLFSVIASVIATALGAASNVWIAAFLGFAATWIDQVKRNWGQTPTQ